MQRFIWRLGGGMFFSAFLAGNTFAQQALTWQEVRARFEAANPSLRAGQIGVEESRANETTAYLRPNPNFSILADQIDPFPGGPHHSTFGFLLSVAAVSYLHERQHKRELRLESAQKATGIAVSGQADLERTLIFDLRMAFVQTLQEKAILDLAKENLTYQLLALLNERTPVEQFDVTGLCDFSRQIAPLDDVRQSALDTRPDLRAALESVDKAKTDHRLAVANGSTDPTFGFAVGRNPPIDQYIGFSVSIPLRIFDRNQGEKLRTQLDIDRSEKLMEAARAQVFSDVDSAYASVNSTVVLLQPYKERYLQQASKIRDTIAFSYEHGAASLLDFLNAQADYRSVQVNYLNLVAAYLDAANQLNLAVGREVIQ